jgi:hypothetical protein
VIERFDPRRRVIPLTTELTGPQATISARLLLDTGLAFTLIDPGLLERAGYDRASARNTVTIAGVNSTSAAGLFIVSSLSALGIERRNLAILAHRLPGSIPYDGLLGVNFLLGRRLIVDFGAGTVQLEGSSGR